MPLLKSAVRITVLLLPLLLLVSCASTPSADTSASTPSASPATVTAPAPVSTDAVPLAQGTIEGEWQFVAFRKATSAFGQLPPPPTFDVLSFSEPNAVVLTSTLQGWRFPGTYTLDGDALAYTFQPPDVGEPIVQEAAATLDEDGDTLTLTVGDFAIAYRRSTRILANSIAGVWHSGTGDDASTIQLGEDGSFTSVDDGARGHYRLWTASPHGTIMTTLLLIPGHGGFHMMWQIERTGDTMTATPLMPEGQPKLASITWTRQGDLPAAAPAP